MEGLSSAVAETDAERAVGRLVEMCADLRSCAIVADGGGVLAESAPNDWGAAVPRLWELLDGDRGATAGQIHVGSEGGELFAARLDGITVVALTDRFALASLMFCDLRAVLRDLRSPAEGGAGAEARDGSGVER